MFITENRQDLFKAISAAQGEFTTVAKNAKNPHFNSKFAPLDSIIEMIRPILPKHGLSVMQHCDIPESGTGIIIETIVAHESGQYISSRLQMPVSKNDPQGYGSSISYGRRYALGAALGIVSDEDVDGNQTEHPPRQEQRQQRPASSDCINEKQQKLIFAKMKEAGIDPMRLKEEFKVESSKAIKAAHVDAVLKWIEGEAKKQPTLCADCREPLPKHAESCPQNAPPF